MRGILFSAVSVCDCLFVNPITPEPLAISSQNSGGIIQGSKGRPSLKMVVVGFTAGDLMSDVLLCNVNVGTA